MKLHIYKGEWGLPSIDLECLQTLCTIKFTEAPIEINLNGNPFFSNNSLLPYLTDDDDKKISGSRKIIKYLETKNYSINSELTRDVQFKSDAYNSVLFNNLHPYFYYIMFGEQKNFDITRKLYANRTPFPFNFYYPGKIIKIADDIINVFCGFSIIYDVKDDHDTEQMVLNAKQCINMLSLKLGNKKWFFDANKPSEFDINVYSYLSILYNIELSINPLQLHIRECSNLLKFINRITKNYFSIENYNSKLHDKLTKDSDKNSSSTILIQSEKEFLDNKLKTQILAFFGAFFAMSSYAMWIGLLKVNFGRDYGDNINYFT